MRLASNRSPPTLDLSTEKCYDVVPRGMLTYRVITLARTLATYRLKQSLQRFYDTILHLIWYCLSYWFGP